jgi:hypothetical protein
VSNENDIKSDYLQSLYGIETLSLEDERKLGEQIAEGDDDALEKLFRYKDTKRLKH